MGPWGPFLVKVFFGLLGLLLFILWLTRLAIVPFTDEEVLENLKEWKSAAELKRSIETTKNGLFISDDKLHEALRIMEQGKKIISRRALVSTDKPTWVKHEYIMEYKVV